ncbi:hypothetical protein [Adhaeribacter rhizoryzae]|uniref:Uncharacterized protein n=1 Tax=Adhaeribacter rhizoryzae TaxID=2607907 RepID=A0A5M6DH31_9BACT|nr:hypothetical protein [Adhaeribacter rhizoryzae]KAA5546733.1 hypothetical protein F0145_10360 [Adhaeribacter rhizoryzae]
MNFKRWLKEEKGGGGLGAFLIIVIIAAAIYAVQFGPSNLLYEPEPAFVEAEYITPEEQAESETPDYTQNTYSRHNQISNPGKAVEPEPVDTEIVNTEILAHNEKPETPTESEVSTKSESKPAVTTTSKTKTKPKVKSNRHRLSNEALVKRKLSQGKTVKQIADETGLDRKYIREVKRRTQQVVW